jgi:Ni/Co efflux regulator RcnB
MRKTILLGAVAAMLLPAAAQAQSQGELNRDRRDIHRQERELHQAQARGDWRGAREERHDVRDARQEYREDLADRNRAWARDDWRAWRNSNRAEFARGAWNAPFRYTAFRPGLRIGPAYYGSRYVIADPWRYHLRPIAPYQRWVRHYDDLLLVDVRRGVVVDVMRGFYF